VNNLEQKADELQGLGKSCMGIGCMIPLIIILGTFLFLVIGSLF
jgi:hypothetical protein